MEQTVTYTPKEDIQNASMVRPRCDPAGDGFMKEIYSAALNEDVETVNAMVKDFESYFRKINGKTILHGACAKGHTSLARLLVAKYSCDLNARDKNGDTPFTCAGLGGDAECVELLINEFNCDINTKGAYGRNILHKACLKGHTSLVRLLVTKYSCDLNACDSNGDTPFICAGLGGSEECVELLINEFHCDINTKGAYGRTILHNACFKGHTSLVRLLVTKYNCDLNDADTDGETPFTCAGLGGSVECVELLINEFHCDINTKGSDGGTILHNACSKGHASLVRLLVTKYGCDLNAHDANGDTPLTCAGLGGQAKCVELLINEFHCDINTKDFNGMTTLHKAYIKGHAKLLKLLVAKYGCDLRVCTGCQCGASKSDLRLIEKLKEYWKVRCFETVDTAAFGSGDLESVDRVTSSMGQTWFDFGAFIGVKFSHLEDLKGIPSGQMSRIMRWWIGGDTDKFDYFMEPRWHTLVKAIAHPAGGNSVSVAEEIAMSHQATKVITPAVVEKRSAVESSQQLAGKAGPGPPIGFSSEAKTDMSVTNSLITETESSPAMNESPQKSKKLAAPTLGILSWQDKDLSLLIDTLVLDLKPDQVEGHTPYIAAHLIFMCLRYPDHCHKEKETIGFIRGVIKGIQRVTKQHQENLQMLAFWLANTTVLSLHLRRYGEDNQHLPANEHSIKTDVTEYSHQLNDLAINIYNLIIRLSQEWIHPFIVPCMLEYEGLHMGTVGSTKGNTKGKANVPKVTVKDLVNTLEEIVGTLEHAHVDHSLVMQVFKQIFYYINGNMLNSILLSRETCHWEHGFQIYYNLSQLEEWCRKRGLADSTVLAEISPVYQTCKLLQMNKTDVTEITSICNSLNPLQIHKILTQYINDLEAPVPNTVLREVEKMGEDHSKPTKLMVNLQHLYSITLPTTSVDVNFQEITLPPTLKANFLIMV